MRIVMAVLAGAALIGACNGPDESAETVTEAATPPAETDAAFDPVETVPADGPKESMSAFSAACNSEAFRVSETGSDKSRKHDHLPSST